MQASDVGRIIVIMLAIGVIVFIVVQIANFARNATNGDDNDNTTTSQQAVAFANYANPKSAAVMYFEGDITAKEDHRTMKISVSQKQRKYELIRGYDKKVLDRRTYNNTPAAYRNFLKALDFYGTAVKQDGDFGDDEEGVCPTGTRTVVELRENNEEVLRVWAASCNRGYGTMKARSSFVKRLFDNQIPDLRELLQGVRF